MQSLVESLLPPKKKTKLILWVFDSITQGLSKFVPYLIDPDIAICFGRHHGGKYMFLKGYSKISRSFFLIISKCS